MPRSTKSLSNIKIRKHSEEEESENKRPKPDAINKPSVYFQTKETISTTSTNEELSSETPSSEIMSAKNDMTSALIEAFKNKDVIDILHGYCTNVIEETKKELETKITTEVEKINITTADLEERTTKLESMAEEFEQQKRNHNVIVRGLRTCDDYTQSIVNMTNQGLGITANAQDIKFIIKLTLKNEAPGTSSVKVSFHDKRLRDEIYGRRLKLKGTDVFVSEDSTLSKSGLAFAARQYARENSKVTTWTMDGQVYIKDEEEAKPRAIYKQADLKPAPLSTTRQFESQFNQPNNRPNRSKQTK